MKISSLLWSVSASMAFSQNQTSWEDPWEDRMRLEGIEHTLRRIEREQGFRDAEDRFRKQEEQKRQKLAEEERLLSIPLDKHLRDPLLKLFDSIEADPVISMRQKLAFYREAQLQAAVQQERLNMQRAMRQEENTATYARSPSHEEAYEESNNQFIQARLNRQRAMRQEENTATYARSSSHEEAHEEPKNQVEAVKLHHKAAEQGDAKAQYALGIYYANGDGVPQDYITSHMWLNLSSVQGGADAKKARDLVAARMTKEQIAEAQKRASEWLERHKK